MLYLFQCFSAGAEIGPHKNEHAYQFMVSLLKVLFAVVYSILGDIDRLMSFCAWRG
jgi:hypothetical protein